MNVKQKVVLVVIAVLVVGMLFYPPFYQDLRGAEGRGITIAHYGPLFGELSGRLDFWWLLAQWITVGIVGAIAYVACWKNCSQ